MPPYNIKAYATNSVGTAYSGQLSFTTLALAPVLTTTDLSAVTSTTATSGGNITNDGGAAVTARGVCWSTLANPTTASSKIADASGGTGSFTSNITGLTAGTVYYVRAYAINSQGTAYGSQQTFTTSLTLSLATLTTTAASNITATGATLGGNVTNDGNASVTERGVVYATTQTPTIANTKVSNGTGTGSFTSNVTGLTPGVIYYVGAYATNSIGTAYGQIVTFTTPAATVIPSLTTTTVTAILATSATSGGNITSDGGGTITARGVCWSTSTNPTTASTKTTDGTGSGNFISNLTGLTANTTYYVRAYAANSIETGYGSVISFKTSISSGDNGIIFNPNLTYSTVTDIDGNVYKTIQIGTQIWMAENLKTTKYRNGDPISNVTVDAAWTALDTGTYCWYNNDAITYKATYGAIYNWYTVNDSRNIAPTGWHVPSHAEWTTLTTYLGGESVAGGMLTETGTSHWSSPNLNATNSSGFTALPSGSRGNNGSFYDVGGWWSSTEFTWSDAWYRYLGGGYMYKDGTNKGDGLSVRCLKD